VRAESRLSLTTFDVTHSTTLQARKKGRRNPVLPTMMQTIGCCSGQVTMQNSLKVDITKMVQNQNSR